MLQLWVEEMLRKYEKQGRISKVIVKFSSKLV